MYLVTLKRLLDNDVDLDLLRIDTRWRHWFLVLPHPGGMNDAYLSIIANRAHFLAEV